MHNQITHMRSTCIVYTNQSYDTKTIPTNNACATNKPQAYNNTRIDIMRYILNNKSRGSRLQPAKWPESRDYRKEMMRNSLLLAQSLQPSYCSATFFLVLCSTMPKHIKYAYNHLTIVTSCKWFYMHHNIPKIHFLPKNDSKITQFWVYRHVPLTRTF